MSRSTNHKYLILCFLGIILPFLKLAAQAKYAKPDYNIPVFIYHRIGDDRYPSTNIPTNVFEEHIKYLKNNDFNIITLSKALGKIQQEGSLPQKTVVLSIDDAYLSFFRNGLPLLEKYDVPATLFINTETIGGEDFMNWSDVQYTIDQDFEIGNHSHSHEHFVNQPAADFRKDLERSEQIFQERLGIKPSIYSYPYGEWNPEMKSILKENGYTGAAGQHSGVLSEYSDLFDIPRFPMTGYFGKPEKFIEKLHMLSLPVSVISPESPIIKTNNPPLLKVKLMEPGMINTESFQCFVHGSPDGEIDYGDSKNNLTLRSTKNLTARRTLYTITAQSSQDPGSWFWWSWLWIIPDVEE